MVKDYVVVAGVVFWPDPKLNKKSKKELIAMIGEAHSDGYFLGLRTGTKALREELQKPPAKKPYTIK